jgi:hypothetical protein
VIGRQVTYPMFDQITPESVLEYKDQRLRSRPDRPVPRIRIRHLSSPLTRNQWLDIILHVNLTSSTPIIHDPPLLDGTFSFTGPPCPTQTPPDKTVSNTIDRRSA